MYGCFALMRPLSGILSLSMPSVTPTYFPNKKEWKLGSILTKPDRRK